MDLMTYIVDRISKLAIDHKWIEFINSDRKAIIYGAGKQARIVIDFCKMFNKDIYCLMTTDSRQRWGLLPRENEMPLYLYNEFPEELNKDDYDIIISMNSKYNEEITKNLNENGYSRVFGVNNWDELNMSLRDNYFELYFDYYGCEYHEDEEHERYLTYKDNLNDFKMYFPYDRLFNSNTVGELGNIVLPSLFNDDRISCLGPYEYGDNVRLHKDDIVLDLGANVGLFSCVAAARGCRVYAFEPAKMPVMKYLKKNASLYSSIEIVPKAVREYSGRTDFYYNDRTDNDYDMCQSSIHKELNPAYSRTEVECITIDEFVQREHLSDVNFIKSHIEYTERNMLEGAQRTLKRFHPVLSFYSQKELGNEQYKEIEALILKANSNYEIIYSKRRIYAYVR